MTTRKGGAPKGKANNPKGTNQYAEGKGTGEKDSQFTVRVSEAEKQFLREVAQKEGMSLSSWILSVAREAAAS
jgi:predicted HicB family RNase H-like nuclease